MNILVLIISNDSLPNYKYNREVWRSYMNNYSNIHCYFIENSMDESKTYPHIENRTIFFKGEETFQNIIVKTLNSIDYFINSDIHYDFVVRTNLSSVWDFDVLQSYLKTLPSEKVYSGPRGPYYHLEHHYFMFYFIGGMGIIMSNDVCKLLIENRETAESFKNMDDIDIGYTLNLLNIPQIFYHYYDVTSLSSFEDNYDEIKKKEQLFYRTKCSEDNRDSEPIYMRKIVNLLYNL
jgi:hypothetical protein